MSELFKRAAGALIRFQIFLALLLFLPAGSLSYWQGWVYWGLFAFLCTGLTLYFLRYDPGLIERRLNVGLSAESRKSQKIIQGVASALVFATYLISGLDHRFGLSEIPVWAVLAEDGLVALSFAGYFFVFRQNRFAAATVRVEGGQQVISNGLYGVVRHPMYSASVMMFLATPIALGSFWGLLTAIPLCITIAVRLIDEERALSTELSGYTTYCQKVRYRLVPLIW